MRKSSLTLLVAATIGLAASQASAADLPRKAPAYVPPAPPPITWTGCYIGANIGGIFTDRKADFGFGEVSTDNSGFAGGGQIGCDYQFSGGWVIGFRNMFDGTSLNRDVAFVDPGTGNTGTLSFKNNWFDASSGLRTVQMSPLMVLTLALSPGPEQAGRQVAALNGCSRGAGRHFWKATTWTSAITIVI
jgi:hypothetical protein